MSSVSDRLKETEGSQHDEKMVLTVNGHPDPGVRNDAPCFRRKRRCLLSV